jgi:flagellar motor switch protein FliN/FliY
VPLLKNEPAKSSPPPKQKQPSGPQAEVQRILRLSVPVIVKLAERRLSLQEVLRFGNGSIIEFGKSFDEPLELMINNKVIGLGETVKVGENFGLRITQIGDVKAVIKSMGK